MHFIFDGYTPARHFKRNTPFEEDRTFPSYGKPPYEDLTETDTEPGLMPFVPSAHKYVNCVSIRTFGNCNNINLFRKKYLLRATITRAGFMNWTSGKLQKIEVGYCPSKDKPRNTIKWEEKKILAPYDRIVAQLIAEDEHGKCDKSHKALRRQSYVQRILDDFWVEIKNFEGNLYDFIPKMLTPLLQRQFWGVEENYGPSVQSAVSDKIGAKPTILQASQFYLSTDPTDPYLIPNYRGNIIHIPEAR